MFKSLYTPPITTFGEKSSEYLNNLIKTKSNSGMAVVLIDKNFYEKNNNLSFLKKINKKNILLINHKKEPTVQFIDELKNKIVSNFSKISIVVGIGGGSMLDTAKAISNLITNPGSASKYQGWDLLKKPGIFKVGVPTLSGTGSESSKTCVLTNDKTFHKLGMNSKFSVFDELILDPNLNKTVEKKQYFYSAMDAYIHAIESLSGSFRNSYADNYSNLSKNLIEEIFLSNNPRSIQNRSKLMLASYYGGLAISSSFVGLIHPISAALSVVYGFKHCYANCISFRALGEFYPTHYKIFNKMCKFNNIKFGKKIKNLKSDDFEKLVISTLVHEKPLYNALGKKYKEILNKEKLWEIFNRI